MKSKLEFRILFIVLMIIPMFTGRIKDFTFGLVILISALLLIKKLKNDNLNLSLKKEDIFARIFIAAILIIIYSFFNSFYNGFSSNVLERLIQLIACLVVLLVSSEYIWTKNDYKFCLNVIRIIILICVAMWPLSGFRDNYFNGFLFTRGNALGGALFCYMGIYLCLPKYKFIDKIILCMALFLMYLANSRSSLLAFIIFITLRYLFTRKKIKKYKMLFPISILTFTLFPAFYMFLFNSNFRSQLDSFSWKYFRKRFFSGRQHLWGSIIELIKKKPLIGYGLDAIPQHYLGTVENSSHNWYFQILFQMGIIGYAFMINILNVIWKSLIELKTNFISLSCSAFLIGTLFWQCFEVTLTQNNISIGILVWFVIGMGVNKNLISFSNDSTN